MSRKVKILRIIARLNIGGPAIHAILLTGGLDKDRFDSLLITGVCSPAEGNMDELMHQMNVAPVLIKQMAREINPVADLRAFAKICRIVMREKPDIIHTHTAKAGTLGRLAAILYNLLHPRANCRLVHTFHGHIFEGYFGKTRTFIFLSIERILALFTDRIIVVSVKIKEDLLLKKIGKRNKISVVSLGLDLRKFIDLESVPAANTNLKIGIVGRLVPIKNHRMFIEAAAKLSGRPLEFFIIGDGELRGILEDHTRKLGLDNKVFFTGWQKDLPGVYQGLDVVVLTSLNEGTPVSIIEAMACARPVIATDVGGVRDLIGDNQRGILVKSGDVAGLAETILNLAQNTRLRRELGEKGREFVRSRFDKERLIKDMELLYNNILEKRS